MIRSAAAALTFVIASLWLIGKAGPTPAPVLAPERVVEDTRVSATATLLAFIDTSSAATIPANRSQSLWARSVDQQYERSGVRVVVIQNSSGQDKIRRLNTYYDWGLNMLTVIPDPYGRVSNAYDVVEFPAVVLLNASGQAVAMWNGYTPPSTVGPVLSDLLARDESE